MKKKQLVESVSDSCPSCKKLTRRTKFLERKILREVNRVVQEHNRESYKWHEEEEKLEDTIKKLNIQIETYEYELRGYQKQLERKEKQIKDLLNELINKSISPLRIINEQTG